MSFNGSFTDKHKFTVAIHACTGASLTIDPSKSVSFPKMPPFESSPTNSCNKCLQCYSWASVTSPLYPVFSYSTCFSFWRFSSAALYVRSSQSFKSNISRYETYLYVFHSTKSISSASRFQKHDFEYLYLHFFQSQSDYSLLSYLTYWTKVLLELRKAFLRHKIPLLAYVRQKRFSQ